MNKPQNGTRRHGLPVFPLRAVGFCCEKSEPQAEVVE